MSRHQKRSMFRVPCEFISKEIYPKLTYWAINANSFHERMNFSLIAVTVVVARILCLLLLAEVSPVRQCFFFRFFVSLKQAEKEKSKALDKYLRKVIIAICFSFFKLLLSTPQRNNTNVTWHRIILHYSTLQIPYITLHYKL